MILDRLSNSDFYSNHHPLFKTAFDHLKTLKESDFDGPKHSLQGDDCFVLFFKGIGKGAEQVLLEAHRKYIDIQLIFKGSDLMGFKEISECKKIYSPYHDQDDYILFDEQAASTILVQEKYFTIFYPSDAHAPLIGTDDVLKAVVKIKIQ